jgi:D-alanyl-D-alanine dipeptidase
MANDQTLVFLDANVLAKPVTRTLLLVGADPSSLTVTWSSYVETEAERHTRGRAVGITQLRARLHRYLGPTGVELDRFSETSPKD